MLQIQPWKIYLVVGSALAALILSIPNFVAQSTLKRLPGFMQRSVPLGLDLRGGAHLLLAMSEDEVKRNWLVTLRDDARKYLQSAKIGFQSRPQVVGSSVQVRTADVKDTEKAMTELNRMVQTLSSTLFTGGGTPNLTIKRDESGLITITPTEPAIKDRVSNAISAAIETVRNRVDPTGTTEPNIVRQGLDRILVQVPGVEDTEELKKRIGDTARLSLHLLHPSMTAEQVSGGQPPSGYKVHLSPDGKQKYLLAEPAITGEMVTNAVPGLSSRGDGPAVSFQLNNQGGTIFAKLTRENIGKPFAIVLDDKVLSAPRIMSQIPGGSAEITGGDFTMESVTRLAIQLRSGALPAKLTVVEERTVGPTLGADSIAAGVKAGIIGALVTIAMTIFAYGTFGVFAVVSLIINGLLILAIMSLFGSTLTLPGIAGLVLTIGMAVDSNVLIFERIREELRSGKTPIASIEAGFTRAITTIADSQLTTLAAAIIMFWLGSGPIRGFAVTLTIGIFTSVFTAVTVTRLMIALWLRSARARQRNIEVPI